MISFGACGNKRPARVACLANGIGNGSGRRTRDRFVILTLIVAFTNLLRRRALPETSLTRPVHRTPPDPVRSMARAHVPSGRRPMSAVPIHRRRSLTVAAALLLLAYLLIAPAGRAHA